VSHILPSPFSLILTTIEVACIHTCRRVNPCLASPYTTLSTFPSIAHGLLYAARPSITPCAPFFNPSHTCHLHPLIVKRQKSLRSVLVGKVYSCFCSSCYKRDLMVIHGSHRQHIIPHSASRIFLPKT
jgi:hypothetical protein